MQLKRWDAVEWLELPRIEHPAHACYLLERQINANGFGVATVQGLPDVLWSDTQWTHKGSLDRESRSTLLRRVKNGEVFLIHGIGLEPAFPLLRHISGNGNDTWKVTDDTLDLFVRDKVDWMLSRAAATKMTWAPLVAPVNRDVAVISSKAEPVKKQQPQLKSSFAHEQLIRVAKNSTKSEFVALVARIFGYDIPAKTYIKLYKSLRDGSIKNPEIAVVKHGSNRAAFDQHEKKILVREDVIDRSVRSNDRSWSLLTMLLHEYGHYIDTILRTELADTDNEETIKVADDAKGEEGAKYAYAIALFDIENTSETVYAEYTSTRYSGPLKVDYQEAREAILKSQGEEVQGIDRDNGNLETFESDRGKHNKEQPNESFGHQSIEDALKEVAEEFNDPSVLNQIYFGNWLRDLSQVIDPKILRPPHAPKDLTRYISRDALTKIVDIKARTKFVNKVPEYRKIYAVTNERLGVYRAVEHIDNPTTYDPKPTNAQEIDPDFEPLHPKEYVAVDPATSLKRYISASVDYMKQKLKAAAAAGRGPAGYRYFGEALHVLEDYFSHTNFVELSLRKNQYDVLPWTTKSHGKHEYPVVTGMFEAEDVIASTGGIIAELLFKVEWDYVPIVPGERSEGDEVALILLGEHSDQSYLQRYKQWLALRDELAKHKAYQLFKKTTHNTVGQIAESFNFIFNRALFFTAENVDDYQTIIKGDPNRDPSIDPTHSQLAKDHDTHPFHVLAVTLAKEAVRHVGTAMNSRWNGDMSADPAEIAAAYFVHPNDSTWQDSIVIKWASIKTNKDKILIGNNASALEAAFNEHENEARKTLESYKTKTNEVYDYVSKYGDEIFSND